LTTFGIPTRVRDLHGAVVPSTDEIESMWLALRQQELADLAGYERRRQRANSPILERALADEAMAIAAE
jgi:hypothetical protein